MFEGKALCQVTGPWIRLDDGLYDLMSHTFIWKSAPYAITGFASDIDNPEIEKKQLLYLNRNGEKKRWEDLCIFKGTPSEVEQYLHNLSIKLGAWQKEDLVPIIKTCKTCYTYVRYPDNCDFWEPKYREYQKYFKKRMGKPLTTPTTQHDCPDWKPLTEED